MTTGDAGPKEQPEGRERTLLEASNLGQIVGRLMIVADPEPEASTPTKQQRALKQGGISGAIRAVLRAAASPMSISEIAAASATAITSLQVAVAVTAMRDVERSGTRTKYRYRLCDGA